MAWFNPFSWGGGPDEVDYGPARKIAEDIRGEFSRFEQDARSIEFGVTDQDRELYDESFGPMRDLIMREIEQKLPGLVQGAWASAGARGVSGSGQEATLRAATATGAQTDAANVLSQFGSQQAGQLTQNAQQRAGFELTRNQSLWQNLLQSYKPLQEVEGQKIDVEAARIQQEKQAFGDLTGKIVGAIPLPGKSPLPTPGG